MGLLRVRKINCKQLLTEASEIGDELADIFVLKIFCVYFKFFFFFFFFLRQEKTTIEKYFRKIFFKRKKYKIENNIYLLLGIHSTENPRGSKVPANPLTMSSAFLQVKRNSRTKCAKIVTVSCIANLLPTLSNITTTQIKIQI